MIPLYFVSALAMILALIMVVDALLHTEHFTFEVKLEPRDIWVGLFWDKRQDGTHLYVCVIPLLVFHGIYKNRVKQ